MIEPASLQDGEAILHITKEAGVFDPEEIQCVAELWGEYTQKGNEESGYYFSVYREQDHVLGFACFGQRPLTHGTYDLYWIAVDRRARRNGIGKALLRQVERDIIDLGGRLIVVETSGTAKYAPTRRFYNAVGYQNEATLHDFYRSGDDLIIFTKHLVDSGKNSPRTISQE